MTSLLGYFGLGGSRANNDASTDVRALPANWYTSSEMYELERRAIFSRKWLLVTHEIRLQNTGDYLKYEIAGFEFFLCKDREGNVNGFHNVCRHRAYPVVTEERGSVKILACRYHGWSYGLNGKLAKAPGYQDLEGFDKSKNNLWPIHVKIDNNGFIWINLDGRVTPEIAWDDDFHGVEEEEYFDDIHFDDYEFDHTWEQTGSHNWKIMADNYNECFHQTTDSDVRNSTHLSGDHETGDENAQDDSMGSTFYFPNTTMTVSPHLFFIQRFLPQNPGKTIMKYEVFKNKNSSQEEFDACNQQLKKQMSENVTRDEQAQKELDQSISTNGELYPKTEEGPLYFQKTCRDTVTQFHKREQAAKHEIWPARQLLPSQATISQQDQEFCSGLACTPTQQAGLAW